MTHGSASTMLLILLLLLAGCTLAAPQANGQEPAAAPPPMLPSIAAAQAFRAGGEPVTADADGNLFCEAEEFQIVKPGWRARPWGENYYAATLANTFLSRKAFLGAPEAGPESVATLNVNVPAAGAYLVLARFEAPYRFQAQFRIQIEQNGQKVFERLYGSLDNLKIWAFREKLKKQVCWPWGAVENMVWEGHDALAKLQPGLAKITLIAAEQPTPAGRRNVDVIMLTRDQEQVNERIEKENYLPLDGMLTQAGDVYLKVTNAGAAPVKVGNTPGRIWTFQEHSPYWVHIRRTKPVSFETAAGASSDWVEVGSTMDGLNDGQWGFTASGPCKLSFARKFANGQMKELSSFDANGKLELAADADVRYGGRVTTPKEIVGPIVQRLQQQGKVHGKLPTQTLLLAGSAVPEVIRLCGLANLYGEKPDPRYVDWRGKSAAELQDACAKLTAEQRAALEVVSLGDEIGLPAPDAAAASAGFVAFLKAQGADPKLVDPAAGGDWAKIAFSADPALEQSNPGLYYWSQRYRHDYGIQQIKTLTDVLRANLPNAHIGANFSPHAGGYQHLYLQEVFQWVNCFRADGMTLPWSEDYIWQVPVATPQINGINLDLFRAGLRGKAGRKIHYYVMPHSPGTTPAMWRRLFHNAVGHGMTIVNLFVFEPVHVTYTENYCNDPEMYAMVRRSFHELGLYEDIIQGGGRLPAQVGLWMSETGDIWHDNHDSFAAAKRCLYVAIQDQQLPLDFLVDQDAADGTLNQYQVLYLSDNHVSRASSAKIAQWVAAGGKLLATAGAGMFDEYNQPNTVLRQLLGLADAPLTKAGADDQVRLTKQDLPFAKPLETVTLAADFPAVSPAGSAAAAAGGAAFPVFGIISKAAAPADAKVLAAFADKSPAAFSRTVGKGEVIYCGFLPSLSFFHPAIPMRPVDRGSTDDAMAHFLPTAFDWNAAALLALPARAVTPPVVCDHPLVEAAVIQAKTGSAIVLTNWSTTPIAHLKVTPNIPLGKKVELASGQKVQTATENGKTVYIVPLDQADVLIAR